MRELRAKNDLTQEELAHIANLDRTYINGVENGRRNISIENIEKISNAFDTSLRDFFKSDLFDN